MPAALVGRGPAGFLGLVKRVRAVCTVPDVRNSTSHCPALSLLPSVPQAGQPFPGSGDSPEWVTGLSYPQQYASLHVEMEGVASAQATVAALWDGREILARQVSTTLLEGSFWCHGYPRLLLAEVGFHQ